MRRELKISVILLIISYFTLSIRNIGYMLSVALLVLAYIVSFKILFSILCESLWGIPAYNNWKAGSWKVYKKERGKYCVAALLKVKNIQWGVEDYVPSKFASIVKDVVDKLFKVNPVIVIKKGSELEFFILIKKTGEKLIDIDRDLERNIRLLVNRYKRRSIDLELCKPEEFFKLLELKEKKIDKELVASVILADILAALAGVCLRSYIQVIGVLAAVLLTLVLLCYYRGRELDGKFFYADGVEVGDISDRDIQDFSEEISTIINSEEKCTIVMEVEKAPTRIEAELERKASRKYFIAGTFDWLGTLISSMKTLERATRRREKKEYVYSVRLYTDNESIKDALEGYGFSFIRLPLKSPIVKAIYG